MGSVRYSALGGVVIPIRLGLLAVHENTFYFMPDLNETLLAAMGARHLDQLVGPWSRLGLYHPGPMWFYWAAPFVAAAHDQSAGLILGALALVAACVVVICFVARTSGWLVGATTGAVVLVAMHQLSLKGLAYPWNPTIIIMPVAAGLACAAGALHRGSLPMIVAGGWLGSLVFQSHLGAMALGALIVAASVAGGLVTRRRLGRPVVCWAWVGVVVLLMVPWAPVLVDQVHGTGNLGATRPLCPHRRSDATLRPGAGRQEP